MLTAELRINGVLIGVISIHNVGMLADNHANYEIAYHDMTANQVEFLEVENFNRDRGAVELVKEVLVKMGGGAGTGG